MTADNKSNKERRMSGYENAQVGRYELEVEIGGPRTKVWKALTQDTNSWWLPSFHMVGEGSVITLRAEAGGQLLEKMEGGGSLLWYTVHMVDPGKTMYLVGQSFAEWGGPAISQLKLALEDTDKGCKLIVSDTLIGRVTESSIASLQSGWTELFTKGLRHFCEE